MWKTFLMKIALRGNNLSDWISSGLLEVLAQRGIHVTEDVGIADALLIVNWHRSFHRESKKMRDSGKPTVLVITEPGVVIPQHTSAAFLNKFAGIIEIGRDRGAETIPYFQAGDTSHFWSPEGLRRNRLVAVAANKVSFLKGELYSLRRHVFSRWDVVDVYGKDWDKGSIWSAKHVLRQMLFALQYPLRFRLASFLHIFHFPKFFMGSAMHKLETLAGYKYSLVIENSQEYTSEKLLDSLLAGCIPIYVGANPTAFGFPEGVVLSAGPSLDSLRKAYSSALELDYNEWRKKVWLWLEESLAIESRESSKVMTEVVRRVDSTLRDRKFAVNKSNAKVEKEEN